MSEKEAVHWTLGINPGPHDGAAVLLRNGVPFVMAEQERFSRRKYAPWEPPVDAILYCLKRADITCQDVAEIGLANDVELFLDWLGLTGDKREQFPRIDSIERLLPSDIFGPITCPIDIIPHHRAHAASAFYGSGFSDAAILVMDDRGEDCSTSIWKGTRDGIEHLVSFPIEESLGIYYRTASIFAGFEGEFGGAGKLMGLASYGQSNTQVPLEWNGGRPTFSGLKGISAVKHINLISEMEERFMSYFRRRCFPYSEEAKEEVMSYANFAASVQRSLEDSILMLCKRAVIETGSKELALAGGVALNCTANGRIVSSRLFDRIWVQPAAGDAGTSLGAAYEAYRKATNVLDPKLSKLQSPYIGPEVSPLSAEEAAIKSGFPYTVLNDTMMSTTVAKLLASGKVVGWFKGRAEVGPRALGARSILATPCNRTTLIKLNKIKRREMWRPIAPAILEEQFGEYFEGQPSDSMTIAVKVKPDHWAKIPAVVHVDGTARPQIVRRETNQPFWNLVTSFFHETGIPVLANTSFNLQGEPIVNTPAEAIDDFLRSSLDVVVIEKCLFVKDS